jgi:hypothetical protein
MESTLLASLSAWSIALVPGRRHDGAGPPPGRRVPLPQRLRTVRLDRHAQPASLFLPAGEGPHPAVVLDTDDRGVNLRAEAHRFASIGIAAFFDDQDETPRSTEPPLDLAARIAFLRECVDVNPYELGALWIGRRREPAWLESASDTGVAFLVRILLRPGMAGVIRESRGPGGTFVLDVLAGLSPLEPDVTRQLDGWLLRHVTIRT